MFLRVSKYPPKVIFRNANINVQHANVTGSMKRHNKDLPPQCYNFSPLGNYGTLDMQGFFQDLGQGGAKWQYVIWWGGMALSTFTNLPVPRGGESEPRGGKCSPPPPPLKETLTWYGIYTTSAPFIRPRIVLQSSVQYNTTNSNIELWTVNSCNYNGCMWRG